MKREKIDIDEDFDRRIYLVIPLLLVILIFILLVFTLTAPEAKAEEYSDIEIVNAIYKAEGGQKATSPYGIRSVKCSTIEECRRVCERTVKNNRRRFNSHQGLRGQDFIHYLANKYAPTTGNITLTEKRLNGNWERNIRFFLKKKGG